MPTQSEIIELMKKALEKEKEKDPGQRFDEMVKSKIIWSDGTLRRGREMQIESLVSLRFTEHEIKEAMLMMLELEMNDLLPQDPKHQKLESLINHARSTTSVIDCVDGDFYLMLDGVAYSEEV